MEIITLIIATVLIENIILSQFLGICPFLGVSKKTSNAIGMGLALIFVVVVASIVSYGLFTLILEPLEIQYLSTLTFILVIASLVQFVEMILKKYIPSLYKALGIYLPLITTNCVVLKVALDVIGKTDGALTYNFGKMIAYAFAVPVGYMLVLTLFAVIRERLETSNVPAPFKGAAIALITAALMALAFSGFAGIV